jgi:predicted phage baseplate assembly protein
VNGPLSLDPTLRRLHVCGCCDGLTIEAPVEVTNRAGLPAIAARIGTHGRFKRSLLSRLSSTDYPRLGALRARDDDDFAIALLDGWAVLADVITFYQERIANECYLRTARDRRSLRELARLIGYELRPGVAASVPLSFTLEDAVGAPASATIDVGTRVQSIPGPGEVPQSFETVERIEARPEWNAIRPRMTQPQEITAGMPQVLLRGVTANVRPSDAVLVVAGGNSDDYAFKRVRSATSDSAANTTTVALADDPLEPPKLLFIALPIATFVVQPLKLAQSVVSTSVIKKNWSHADLVAQTKVQKWSLSALKLNLRSQLLSRFLFRRADTGVFVFRQKAAVFGHNAPKWSSLPPSQRYGEVVKDKDGDDIAINPVYPTSWEWRTLAADSYVYLDTTYSRVVTGSYVVIETPSARGVFRIDDVAEESRSDFTINAKVTRLNVTKLSGDSLSAFRMREATVHLESERLPLAELPVVDPVTSAAIALDGPYPELAIGQRVVITGQDVDLPGVMTSEGLTIADARLVDGFTWLTFKNGPVNTYVRSTVTFNANVALATHGESVQEALGGGDSTQPFQSFALRQPPLTHVSADTPAGSRSTLEVRVNDLLWTEVPSFFDSRPDDHVYITRPSEEGGTIVRFGDGRNGARVPSGQENVRARYRKGIGAAGLVRAGQLTLLQSRPLGVRGVVNAVDAAGMGDRETLDEARVNAPLVALTLGRIVSLRDYADFARAFPGIAKAAVAVTWSSVGRRVFVTVAGPDGAAVGDGDNLRLHLVSAMRNAGDPQVASLVKTFTPAFFTLGGTVTCAADRIEAKVLAELDTALRATFGFAAREFEQPVARSEVVSAMHAVPGVVAVDLDVFHRVDRPPTLETALAASSPRSSATGDLGAELLLLDARPLALTVVRAAG